MRMLLCRLFLPLLRLHSSESCQKAEENSESSKELQVFEKEFHKRSPEEHGFLRADLYDSNSLSVTSEEPVA